MIEVEASVEIQAPPQTVWDYMSQFDNWWLASNPNEHIELSVIGRGGIQTGTELILKERIAGIRGEAIIRVYEYKPPTCLEWKSLSAKFSILGMHINIKEGGLFTLSKSEKGCVLSHRVWGKLDGAMGVVAELIFKYVLKGERKDYEHTFRELIFIKRQVESRCG